MRAILSIDPGAHGGLAVFRGATVYAVALPAENADRLELLREIQNIARREGDDLLCVLEKVGGFVKGRSAPGSAMFNFGRDYGFLLGCLQALAIPVELTPPQKWQPFFSLGKSTDCATPRDWKRKLKAEAQRRFPHIRVTDATGDALLIGEWRRFAPVAAPLANRQCATDLK